MGLSSRAIASPTNPQGGQKVAIYHAARPDGITWQFCTSMWDPYNSGSCIFLAQVGRVLKFDPEKPSLSIDVMRRCLEAIPIAIPPQDVRREPVFTCRVWFREALRRLNEHEQFNITMDPEETMESLSNRTIVMRFMSPDEKYLPVLLKLQPRSAYST